MGKLINWSGHGNLGDDAMASVIQEKLGHLEWDIFGGGTLISPSNEFYSQVVDPEKTVAISVGVSSNWDGQADWMFKKFRAVYTRDYYSHYRLLERGVDNKLSVDLLCIFEPTAPKKNKKWINLLKSDCPLPYFNEMVDKLKLKADGRTPFALSANNDLDVFPNAKVYTDAQELVNDLHGGDVIATRLHANVLAWVAGAKVTPVFYDQKICHFWERVIGMSQKEARDIINKHIDEICNLK